MTATPQTRPASARLPRQARRKQLLGAAREVFVAHGYHAAAMDEIAERAGVSKPVLYQHFPGKLELYLALLDESVEELVGAVSAALSSTADNRERVPATFRAFFDYVSGADETFRLVFESDLGNDPAVRGRLNRAMRECAAMVSEFIRADTDVSHDEAELLGMALVGMAQVSSRYWLNARRKIGQETAEKLLARLAWRGISGWPLAETAHESAESAESAELPSRGEDRLEVKIGIQMAPRELIVETAQTAQEIQLALAAALADGTVFQLSDDKGRVVLVPADKIAYVELDVAEPRRIGFGAS